MTLKFNNIILQGLVGLGLVGYNTIKTLIDTYEADVYQDYAEFFPNLSIIDNGVIENQCVRIFQKELDTGAKGNKTFHFLNGPQPRSDELNSFFLQKIVSDIRELDKTNKIDLFLSFGAYVTKNISHTDIQEITYSTKDELVDKILQSEIEKQRNLYVATSGQLVFDDFVKDLAVEETIIKETQGYISGLNGVLPALIGERLKIPTATIMIETTGTDSRNANFPVLSQFLGLLATKKALQFIEKVFSLEKKLDTKIDTILAELKDTAKQELLTFLDKGFSDEKNRELDYRNDKMYT